MKVFIALCVLFVVLQLGAAAPAALQEEEDDLVHYSMEEAEEDAESANNSVSENLLESDVFERRLKRPCSPNSGKCPRPTEKG